MISLLVQICLESRISLAHSFTGSVIHLSPWYILLLEQIQLYLSLSSFLHLLELGQVVGLTTYQYRRLPENNLLNKIYFGLSTVYAIKTVAGLKIAGNWSQIQEKPNIPPTFL
jgi:hypothetical protein